MQIRLTAATAAALAFSTPALAQDADSDSPPNGLRPGAWSISFSAPGNFDAGERGELGAWRMVGPRTNLGVTLGVSVADRDREGDEDAVPTQTESGSSVQLGLAARRYLATSRSIAPYLQGSAFGGVQRQRRELVNGYEEETSGSSLGAELAVGAEWFPVRQLSISGHTGVRGVLSGVEQDITDAGGADSHAEHDVRNLGSFTSALAVRLYF